MWKKFTRDLRERFLNFESLNGGFILIPWGSGFIYYAIYNEPLSYRYGAVSLGIVLIVWGLRKLLVNRVKQQVKLNLLALDREFFKK